MSIFLQNRAVQSNLVEPSIRDVTTAEELKQVAEFIRGRNYFNLRNGDSKLCRKINGEIALWINEHTDARASLWIAAPYSNIRNSELNMEHVVGVVELPTGERFAFDGTAGQLNFTQGNVIVADLYPNQATSEELERVFRGGKWNPFF